MDSTVLIHFGTIGALIISPVLGVSIGQGIASNALSEAADAQPKALPAFNWAFYSGMALIETAAVLSVLIAFLIAFQKPTDLLTAIAHSSTIICIAIPGFFIGIASAYPLKSALEAISRDPSSHQLTTNLLLISQSIMQAPIIFGFIIAMLILRDMPATATIFDALRYYGCTSALGLGSIGPIIGLGWFNSVACRSLGINREAYRSLFSFSFVSQALIETPILFTLITSFFLLWLPHPTTLSASIAYVLAGFTVAIPTISTGINSGKSSQAACSVIVTQPDLYQSMLRTSIIGQTFIDTTALYGFVVSIILMLTAQ